MANAWRFTVKTPWMNQYMAPTWPSDGNGTWVYVPHPPMSPEKHVLSSQASCTSLMSKSMLRDLKKERAKSPRTRTRGGYHARDRVYGKSRERGTGATSSNSYFQLHVPDEIPDSVNTKVRKLLPRPSSTRGRNSKVERGKPGEEITLAKNESNVVSSPNEKRRKKRLSRSTPWRQRQ